MCDSPKKNQSPMGLLDKDTNPEPSYCVLDRLTHHEWRTNLETRSDPEGIVKLRDFLGRYRIDVAAEESLRR